MLFTPIAALAASVSCIELLFEEENSERPETVLRSLRVAVVVADNSHGFRYLEEIIKRSIPFY